MMAVIGIMQEVSFLSRRNMKKISIDIQLTRKLANHQKSVFLDAITWMAEMNKWEITSDEFRFLSHNDQDLDLETWEAVGFISSGGANPTYSCEWLKKQIQAEKSYLTRKRINQARYRNKPLPVTHATPCNQAITVTGYALPATIALPVTPITSGSDSLSVTGNNVRGVGGSVSIDLSEVSKKLEEKDPIITDLSLDQKPVLEQYGKHVRMTAEQMGKLVAKYGQGLVDQELPNADEWIDLSQTPNGRKYRKPSHNHYLFLTSTWLPKKSLSGGYGGGFKPHCAATTAERNLEYLRRAENEERNSKKIDGSSVHNQKELSFERSHSGSVDAILGIALRRSGS